jgi:hypothetical protein
VKRDTRLPRDDEGARLFAAYEESSAKEHYAASQLLYPGRALPHETYMKLLADLRTIRTECNAKMLAVREHHNKMLDALTSAVGPLFNEFAPTTL